MTLVAAPIALHVEAMEGVAGDDAAELVQSVRAAVEKRAKVVLHEEDAGCASDRKACVGTVRAATGAEAVVLVRAYAAVTTIGLFLELHVPARAARKKNINLRSTKTWRVAIDAVVSDLLSGWTPPKLRPEPALPLRTVAPEPAESGVSAVAAAAFGIGAAAAAASASLYFWASSDEQSLDRALEMKDASGRINGITIADAQTELDSINLRRNTAAGLGLAALGGALTGAIALIVDALDAPDTVAAAPGGSVSVRF